LTNSSEHAEAKVAQSYKKKLCANCRNVVLPRPI